MKSESKVRVTVALDDDIYELLEKIKGKTGDSYSKQISELLREMRPALEMMLNVASAIEVLDVKRKNEIRRVAGEFEGGFESLSKKAQSLVAETNQQIDLFSEAVAKGRKPAQKSPKKTVKKRASKTA